MKSEPTPWSHPVDWLDDLDLAPDGTSLRLGTRRIGDQPWLVTDDAVQAELALKRDLSARRPDDVFAAGTCADETAERVAELVVSTGVDMASAPDSHPLHRAGLSVQEDLCVMDRTDAGWVLSGASLHFPSRWRLGDKLGRPMVAIHQPVSGYEERLSRRVDASFDHLGEEAVVRRNWFLHADDELFQPERPAPRTVQAVSVERDLIVRSERQTLRRVGDSILFTIRVQRVQLRELAARRPSAWREYVFSASSAEASRRGIDSSQLVELRAAVLDG